jgi:hypothetical protein
MIQPYAQQNTTGNKNDNFIRGVITGSVISTVIVSLVFIGIWFIFLNRPTDNRPVYKEYSSVNELYKNAALGERAKVTIMTSNPPNNATGSVNLVESGTGVVFRIPPSQLNSIKLLPGRNIVYVRVSDRVQSSIICDIEKVIP